MIGMAMLKPLAAKARQMLVKNAPGILMALGTTGSVTAVIFAAKATPGAIQAKKDAEFEKSGGAASDDGSVRGVFREDIVKLTPKETLKACGRYYIPALGMELFSLLCFWGAHGIGVKRQAVLAGLYSTAEAALQEYQKKVVEMLGEKGEKEVRNSIAQDKIDANPPANTLILPMGTDMWCLYDDQYFPSSYLKIKEAENDANHEMIQNMYISKQELKWMLDPDRKYLTPGPDDGQVGWSVDKLIHLQVDHHFGPQHQPVLCVTVEDKDGNPYPPEAGFCMMS